MFPVGAVECDWDGGQYVRPQGGQSIQCQGPPCSNTSDCPTLTNDEILTYCKYTKKSDEDIAENYSDYDSGGDNSEYGDSGSGESALHFLYDYRCAVCPRIPFDCYDRDNDYPKNGLGEKSSSVYYNHKMIMCMSRCFNMDYENCRNNGCWCEKSSTHNYQEVNHDGTFNVNLDDDGTIMNGFAHWSSAGCAVYETYDDESTTTISISTSIDDSPDRCWFVDDFVYYCDDDYSAYYYGSLPAESAENCLDQCTNNSNCYRAAWHPADGESGPTCYMFKVGSQKCSWNDHVEKPEGARMIECVGEPCDWDHDEDHGGCSAEGQRAFCDLNKVLADEYTGQNSYLNLPIYTYSSDNDLVEHRCETCPEKPSGCKEYPQALNDPSVNDNDALEWVSSIFF